MSEDSASDDPRIREIYWSRQKAILDEKAAIREAELRLKKGMEEGLKQGIEQGKEEGKREGIEESKLEIAQKMLKREMDIGVISDIVGMSEEEIKNLKG